MTRSERWLFALLVVLACVIVSRGANALRGDAPHYLAATYSIVHDRDLDLTNQYDETKSVRFVPGDPTDLVRPGRTGVTRILPDAWGFAVALIPADAFGRAVASSLSDEFLTRVRWDETRAARDLISFAMALLYGWTAVLVFRLTARIRGTAKGARLATIVAFATPPLLSMSFVVFPDVLAAFLVVLFVLAMTGDRPAGLGAALALVCLPWLGARYLVLTLAGLVWLVTSRSTNRSRRDVLVAALPVASVALVGLARIWTFGSLVPGSPNLNATTIVTTIRGVAGLLLDRDTGLFVLAPFWALAIAGWTTLFERRRSYLVFASAAFVGVWLTAALHREWWGGESPPGRPLVSALPLLVPLLAEGFERVARGWGGGLRMASIAWAGVMAVALVMAPARMWPGSPKVLGLLSASLLDVEVDAEPPAAAAIRARRELLRDVERGNMNAARRYLDAGGDVDPVTPTGRTPLIAAAQHDDLEMLEALIEAGADVNAADITGWTAMIVAVRRGQPDLVGALIASGADVNAATRTGWTPLIWASYQGSPELVGILLDAGADVTYTSKAGRNALVRAAEGGHLEVVRQLLAAGADRETIVDGRRAAEWAAINEHALVAAELTTP